METLSYTAAEGIGHLRLERPEVKNAANSTMWRELAETFQLVDADRSVRALIVTGAGDSFCSGADMRERDETRRHPLDKMRRVSAVARALFELSKPTIAVVQGSAVGGGANLALACDFVLVTEDASFRQVFGSNAMAIDFGGSWLLPRLVGLRHATRLALLGDPLGGAEAVKLGAASAMYPTHEAALEAAAELASRLTASAPLSNALTKRLLQDSFESTFDQCLEAESRMQAVAMTSADFRENFAARKEARSPDFERR